MPKHIEALEAEHQRLSSAAAHPDFYKETPETIRQVLTRTGELQRELLDAYALWDELDSKAK